MWATATTSPSHNSPPRVETGNLHHPWTQVSNYGRRLFAGPFGKNPRIEFAGDKASPRSASDSAEVIRVETNTTPNVGKPQIDVVQCIERLDAKLPPETLPHRQDATNAGIKRKDAGRMEKIPSDLWISIDVTCCWLDHHGSRGARGVHEGIRINVLVANRRAAAARNPLIEVQGLPRNEFRAITPFIAGGEGIRAIRYVDGPSRVESKTRRELPATEGPFYETSSVEGTRRTIVALKVWRISKLQFP